MGGITENITRFSHTEICSTYNSYFIKGEKTAVVDILPSIEGEYEECLTAADYIVFTHTDPNCAKTLEMIFEKNKNAIVVGTAAAIRNYKEILNHSFNEYAVKNEGELDLNGALLKFFIAPNLNQPDTMLVFENTKGALFTGFLYSSFDTDNGGDWFYNDKLSMYKEYVIEAEKTAALLTPAYVCPYIGTVYDGTEEYSYKMMCDGELTAAVYFSSRYGSTGKMAYAIADGLRAGGVRATVFDADNDNWEDMTASLGADMLLFGSFTQHRNALKSIWKLISEIDAVTAPKKTAAVFGSYGWSGEAVRIIERLLKSLKIKLYGTPQTLTYTPTAEQLDELRSFGREMALSVKEK